jgi:hypothetical protein
LTDQKALDQVTYYALAHRDPFFIHQLVVDAYAAQHADTLSKSIYIAFALAGLYLHNERGFTGREVQLAHMRLAKHKKDLPIFALSLERGGITAHGVLKTHEKDAEIKRWSATTWESLDSVHQQIRFGLCGKRKFRPYHTYCVAIRLAPPKPCRRASLLVAD